MSAFRGSGPQRSNVGDAVGVDQAARREALEKELAHKERILAELLGASVRGGETQRREDDEEGDAQVGSLPGRIPETGNLTSALYGQKHGVGYPLAFDRPLGEASHDLVAHGTRWGVGYLEEHNGHWHPVCPFNDTVPGTGDTKPTPTGGGGGGKRKKPVGKKAKEPCEIFLPPAGLTPEQREELIRRAKEAAEKGWKEPGGERGHDGELTPCDSVHDGDKGTVARPDEFSFEAQFQERLAPTRAPVGPAP